MSQCADPDLALHDAWAEACGSKPEHRARLVAHLVEQIGQPSLEHQTRDRAYEIASTFQNRLRGIVLLCLSYADVAGWLAKVGLGLSMEEWAAEREAGECSTTA